MYLFPPGPPHLYRPAQATTDTENGNDRLPIFLFSLYRRNVYSGAPKNSSQGMATSLTNERIKRTANNISASNTVNVVLVIVLSVLILATVIGWLVIRSNKPRRKRNSLTKKSQKSDRDVVSKFYNMKSVGRIGGMDPSKMFEQRKRFFSEQIHRQADRTVRAKHYASSFSYFRSPHVQFALETPPFQVTKPTPIQPVPKTSSPKFYTKRKMNQSPELFDSRMSDVTVEVGRAALHKMSHPLFGQLDDSFTWYRKSSSSSLQSSITCPHPMVDGHTSQKEHMWLRSRRRSSIRSDGFSTVETMGRLRGSTILDPIRHSLDESEESWTNLSLNFCGQGRISFSLSYICTVGALKVTVNRLTGVHQLRAPEHLLPSQTQNSFVVGLRLGSKSSVKSELFSEGLRVEYSTHTVTPQFNPVFDQTFSFKLSISEIDLVQLIFFVFKTSTTVTSSAERSKLTSGSNTPCDSRKSSLAEHRIRKGEACGTVCLGCVRYNLSRDDLINRPEKLQEIWRDIESASESETHSPTALRHASTAPSTKPGLPLRSALVQQKQQRDTPTPDGQSAVERLKPAVEVSIHYELLNQFLCIRLNDARSLEMRRKDVSVFARVVLYKGDKILATARTQSVRTFNTSIITLPRNNPTGTMYTALPTEIEAPFPRGEIVQFPIDTNRIIEGNTIGITVYVCARSRFGLSHLIGQCSIGASGFTDGNGTHHWDNLVEAVKQLKQNSPSNTAATSTKVFTHWHELCSSSM